MLISPYVTIEVTARIPPRRVRASDHLSNRDGRKRREKGSERGGEKYCCDISSRYRRSLTCHLYMRRAPHLGVSGASRCRSHVSRSPAVVLVDSARRLRRSGDARRTAKKHSHHAVVSRALANRHTRSLDSALREVQSRHERSPRATAPRFATTLTRRAPPRL